MILTIDVGNTNICFGVYNGEKLVFESRVDTNASRMGDQYAVIFNDILGLYDVEKNEISGAIVSSVVPPVTNQMVIAIEHLFGTKPLIVGPGVKTGLNIQIDDPSTLGADLVCSAVAAKEMYKLPCVVIDVGTATKIFAVDKNGSMQGGIIAPGVRISLEALADKTASLPLISLDGKLDTVIGKNTIDCMRSGMLYGTAGMIDGFVDRFEEELGKSSVVATGGYSTVLEPYCKHEFDVNPHLILDGLRLIYEKNTGKKEKKR